MVTIVPPRINMNGTSKGELQDQYVIAHSAVQKAIIKVGASAPHGRDYQTYQTVDSYIAAAKQHRARLQKLADVLAELAIIINEIDEQGGGR